jgi:hypothetical protein
MNKQTKWWESDEGKQEKIEEIFTQKAEILDLFCKTFIVQEVKDPKYVHPECLRLINTQEMKADQIINSYEMVFIDPEEKAKLKEKLVVQEAAEKARTDAISEVKKAFWETFHEAGEIWFPYPFDKKEPEHEYNESITQDWWNTFEDNLKSLNHLSE